MFKCTGICSQCGKCNHADSMKEANERKTELFTYPEDFQPDKGMPGTGVAFDIGTTTVVGMLWDLRTGTLLGAEAATNPQNEYGMDVISRITYCGKDRGRQKILKDRIIGCLNALMKRLCTTAGRSPDEIRRVAICGNTAMSHIAAGFSPTSLAVAPFVPAYTGMIKMRASAAGLEINPMADVLVLPHIAGHIGGDITAGVTASRVLEQKGLTAYIDIGTNGEMVLSDGGTSYACSTAAGPAFEGASIECGMRAADGAIERVWIEAGEVFFRTIGAVSPQGICGSGLIDAIGQMLDAGLINKKGRLISAKDAEAGGMPQSIVQRLAEFNGKRKFILVKSHGGEDIFITQNDIRAVQLAKGAVAAGMKLMLEKMGKTVDDLERVMVAGAFGSYIDKTSALRIGLLPHMKPEKIASVGNAAGVGVSMALVSDKELKYAEKLPAKIKHLDLGQEESFQKAYMKAMGF